MIKIRYTLNILMAAGIVGGLLLTSCSRDVFNEDDYNRIINEATPLDSVEANHHWMLTEDLTYVVKADINVGAKYAYILSENPLTALNSEVMAQGVVEDGGQVTLKATVPIRYTELYAALVDANGLYTVVSFPVTSQVVSFANVISTNKQKSLKAQLAQQKMVFCFEEEMPEPGDFDYNDVVLRISREIVNSRHLKIEVELAAVGASKQLAAGLHLLGYQAEDIDSVTIEGGGSFDLGGYYQDEPLQKTATPLFESSSLLQSGRNGEAFLYLFEDAHWAMGDELDVVNGVFPRKKYNVSKGSNILPTRTEIYHVYLKEGKSFDNFTAGMFDPFILSPYYGALWEIHCYRDREAQIYLHYSLVEIKKLPWAFMIPDASFRYPLEGVNIGFYKNGALFGAYMTPNHSFGEWAIDHTKCLDWYLYPTFNQIF